MRQLTAVGAAAAVADVGASGSAAAQGRSSGLPMPAWPTADSERAAGVSPVNLQFAPGDVRRYGADPSGSLESTQAFIDANSVATHGVASVRIPSGKYKYAPTATMNIAVAWLGEGAHETIILCDTAKFSGEFFRIVGSTETRDLLFQASGPVKGTGIRLAPADSAQFTGHARLSRIWVFGFNCNIQCDNNFIVTLDQVRSAMGNEGFYCAPDQGEGNGYATTHLQLNCYYAQNARNVFYAPSIRFAFRTITFIGGSFEGATGSSCQASFTRCSPLKFLQIYLEGAPKIPALVLNDCFASIDGAYLNGTGGIKIGTNTRINLRQLTTTTGGDLFSGGDGTQQVVMESCSWPATGNNLSLASVSLRNTTINGTIYRDCEADASSLGPTRFSRQTTVIAGNQPQDVYRFTGVDGSVAGGSICGRFEVIARDKGDGSNQAVYECWIGSAGGGAKHASLTLLQRLVRGSDPGATAAPLSLVDDGGRGGVKLQFTKSSGLLQAVVDVLFHGLCA